MKATKRFKYSCSVLVGNVRFNNEVHKLLDQQIFCSYFGTVDSSCSQCGGE